MGAATTAALATSGTLRDLLARTTSHDEISTHLDSLSTEDRLAQVLAVRGRNVKALYEAVKDAPPVPLEEFLPLDEKGTRIYEGRNSLALFSRFQKRFHRLEDGTVVGYNHQFWRFLTGPGYFVTKAPSGEGLHGDEILFDYTVTPPGTPPGWPRFKPNTRGFSRLVYMNMKDYCRRVASGVVVGKAYILGIDRDAYFSLTYAG